MLLNPTNRIHMEGIIQALRERLRPVDHVLGHVQHQETPQYCTHHRPRHRIIITRPRSRRQSRPMATHQPHQTRGGSHQHSSDRHERNQAPRNTGLTQHNRGDSHQGKGQQRRIKNAQTCGNTQRPAHRIAGAKSQHDRQKQQRNSCQPAHQPSFPHSSRTGNPSNTGVSALSST